MRASIAIHMGPAMSLGGPPCGRVVSGGAATPSIITQETTCCILNVDDYMSMMQMLKSSIAEHLQRLKRKTQFIFKAHSKKLILRKEKLKGNQC